MDVQTILSFAKEFFLLILVFAALFAYSIVRGKRALISLILGLYIALLISLKFPYYEAVYNLTSRDGNSVSILTIVVFAVFTALGTLLFEHLLSYDYNERAVEDISKKLMLAVLGTVLVMAYSYHVLPVTSLIDPGSAVSALFAPSEYFFWMILIPLIGLFFI